MDTLTINPFAMKHRFLVSLLLLALSPFTISAQSSVSIVTTTKSGNWSDPTVWARGQVPSANDEIVLRHNLIIDQPATCKSMNLNNHNLQVNSNINFNVVGVQEPLTSRATFYNGTATSSSKLIAIYRHAGLGIDFLVYGMWAADTITKVTSVSVRKLASPDTTLNFLFNDSLEVTHYYMEVAGVKDTSIFRINYQKNDSNFVVYRLYTDWQNTVLLRSTHSAFIGSDTSFVTRLNQRTSLPSCPSHGDNLANIAIGNAVRGLAGLAIVAVGFSPLVTGIAAAAYIAVGFWMFYQEQVYTLNAIGRVFESLWCGIISPAYGDDKPPRNDDLTPNPTPPVATINNSSSLLFGCPCMLSWTSPRSSFNFAASVLPDRWLYTGALVCPDAQPGDAPRGILFHIPKGSTSTVSIVISYFTTCPINVNLKSSVTYSATYKCN